MRNLASRVSCSSDKTQTKVTEVNIPVAQQICKMVESFSSVELASFLEDNGVSEEVVEAFLENDIEGNQFLSLSELEVKELAPKIGHRVKLRQIIVSTPVRPNTSQ